MTYKSNRLRICRRAVRAISVLLACVILSSVLSACWSSRELDELAIVMGVGLDAAAVPDHVVVTAQIAKVSEMESPSAENGVSPSGNAYNNVSYTGESVFGSVREMTRMVSRRLYFPHNQIIVLGWDLCKKGVTQDLDLFMREYEARIEMKILVARETAREILAEKTDIENLPALHILDMLDTHHATSEIVAVTFREFQISMLSKTTSPVAPIIEMYIDPNSGQAKARMSGTAVFKDGKLVGELNHEQTRGLLWVKGKVKSGVLHVEAPGGKASLEISHSRSKVTPILGPDGKFSIKIQILENGMIGSQESPEDLSTLENVKMLEAAAQEAIRAEISSAIEQAKLLRGDVFGFGDAISRKYPDEWEKIKGEWDSVFRELETEVEVKTRLRSTGAITKAITPGGAA